MNRISAFKSTLVNNKDALRIVPDLRKIKVDNLFIGEKSYLGVNNFFGRFVYNVLNYLNRFNKVKLQENAKFRNIMLNEIKELKTVEVLSFITKNFKIFDNQYAKEAPPISAREALDIIEEAEAMAAGKFKAKPGLTDAGLMKLFNNGRFKGVKDIDFSGSKVTPGGLTLFFKKLEDGQVRSLNLSGINLKNTFLIDEDSNKFTGLTFLKLDGCRLTDRDVLSLKTTPNDNLQLLSLHDNDLSPEHIIQILKNNSNLRYLDISQNPQVKDAKQKDYQRLISTLDGSTNLCFVDMYAGNKQTILPGKEGPGRSWSFGSINEITVETLPLESIEEL